MIAKKSNTSFLCQKIRADPHCYSPCCAQDREKRVKNSRYMCAMHNYEYKKFIPITGKSISSTVRKTEVYRNLVWLNLIHNYYFLSAFLNTNLTNKLAT